MNSLRMFSRSSKALYGTVIVSLACIGTVPAFAQTAGQMAKPSYAPSVIAQKGQGAAFPLAEGIAAPDGAENLQIKISGVIVEGGLPEMADKTRDITARITGKRVTAADLFKVASELEVAYSKAGYILARVSLPPQAINDGHKLRLVVTKGYVEAIDSSALPARIQSRVKTLLSSLVGRNDITRIDLERQLLLAGDTPGLMLKSVLKPGGAPGATVIVVEGRHDLVSGSVSFGNAQSEQMGTWAGSLGVNFNSVFGFGEVIYANLSGYPEGEFLSINNEDPRNRQVVLGVTTPLGTKGLWLGLEAVDSHTHPTSSAGFTVPDHFQRVSTKLGYHWLRSRNANLSSELAFDWVHEKQETDIGGTRADFTEDRLRILRLKQSGNIFPSWGGSLSGEVNLSVGLDAFGARSATTAVPLTRDKANPNFAKLGMQARFNHAFGDGLGTASLAMQAQTSFGDALVTSEQMALGGTNWLSAFDSGKFAGDSAIVARAEVTFPRALPLLGNNTGLGAAVAPYLYVAGGISQYAAPTAVEREETLAASFGVGMRLGLSQTGTRRSSALTMEFARGMADGTDDENRFNISLRANF